MNQVINKKGVTYHEGMSVTVLGKEGRIEVIDMPNHRMRIRTRYGLSVVDIDASENVLRIPTETTDTQAEEKEDVKNAQVEQYEEQP